MSTPITRAILAAALLLSIIGCSREQESSSTDNKTQSTAEGASSPALESAAGAPASAIQEAFPPATELQIDKIQTVMVRRAADAPTAIVIRASGSVVSPGWTIPRLTPMEDASERVRVFSFVATSPETPGEDRSPQSIQTEIRVNDVPPDVRTVRIVAANNAISAPIAQ